MRTTIEIRDDQRAQLLELAARRGQKGFSHLVQEAIDQYLGDEAGRREKVRRALSAIGSLDEEAAERLQESTSEIRATWR